MKRLFDQNLSPLLVARMSDLFPGTMHVRELGLARADATRIWKHAQDHQFTIVSKDSDFHQMSFMLGPPPKVIWIRRGNCSTAETERILRSRRAEILAFANDPETAFLALS
ncbi:MAG: hypothetical protein EA421_11580 [Gemmatimonadales bacterium]|nr:MAG: hypothetical protein EA421_11580 [Gemmatimonadales bacterium]